MTTNNFVFTNKTKKSNEICQNCDTINCAQNYIETFFCYLLLLIYNQITNNTMFKKQMENISIFEGKHLKILIKILVQ